LQLHNDLQDNILHIVRGGKKRLVLFPPSDSEFLYENISVARTETRVSPIDPDSPDLMKYPKFALAHPFEVVVEEGSVIVCFFSFL
jgi:hypothetical protein